MKDVAGVDARLEQLERDNRRLRMSFGAVLLLLGAALLVGAVMPEQIPDLIEARAFRVVDENGTERAAIDGTGISYFDENGTTRAAMRAAGIGYFDKNGTVRAAMDDVGIRVFDENDTTRAAMGAAGIGYFDENFIIRAVMDDVGIRVSDENGTTRALMGNVELVTPATGAETRYPAAIVLYDAEGHVIWRAPQ